ncbi:BTAD domain-containing putative transcriptional regulator [Nakamurella endophytica]|uniref:ATPase AAA n=1 Tax=Nakamurella endophytica TaxID=1748367 RepID=A0A917TDD8_9ACTN|nr:BTAD domain-containing putative transcriptional regulator [Nakamurella endophytica]GGM18194.1 ATPase AAA [Nakamurella endophytica]
MEYRVLGPLEVVRDGVPVDVGGPKQRAVLAVLLLDAGRVVPADRIVDAVWGADHPPSVMAGLQAYVSNLRRVLRDDGAAVSPIVRRPPGYLLDVPPGAIDLTRFADDAAVAHAAVTERDWSAARDAATRALALWRGPLLADLQDEPWVQPVATGLQERRGECTEDLVTALLGLGDITTGLGLARDLHSADPLRERACWLYAVALYRAGRPADALAAYREHARVLDDELGLEPGPALRDLQGAILRQDPELSSWPGRPAARVPGVVEPAVPERPAPPPEPEPDTADSLVGRRRELATVTAALSDGGGWVILTGPAGIGKTRLAQEAAGRWSRDVPAARVLRVACPDDEGVPDWWPVRQLVRELGADPDAVLSRPAAAGVDAARFAVYERLLALLRAAADDGPLLVLVDDVQWADSTSVRFLTHLAGSAAAIRLGVVLTVRDGPAGPDLGALLAAAVRRPGTRQLAVPPLDAGEVGELVRRISGEPVDRRDADVLAARTGGNPFFVGEYARLPAEDRAGGSVPVAVRSVLGRRLSALDPAVLQVLRAAAVIGEPFDPELLRAVTRLDTDELADLLDDAADERIVQVSPGAAGWRFAHGLLRDEVLAGISDVRVRRLHLRVAEAVSAGGGVDRLVRRAAHLTAALPLADPAEALVACRAAAVDAEQRWNSDAAAQWWGTALRVFDQLPEAGPDRERDELVIARVAALARAGRGQTVLDVVDAAVLDAVRAGRTSSVGRLASALLRTTGAWPWAVYGEDPAPLLSRLAGVEQLVGTDPVAHAQVLAALAVGSCYDPDGTVPDLLAARAVEVAERSGDPDALADALLGRALTFSGVAERAAESVEILERLAGLPHRQQQVDDVLRHGLLTMATLTLGRVEDAARHVRQGIAGSELLRLPVSRAQLRWTEGMLAQWRGELGEAERLYDHAYELHQQTELYRSGVHYLAMLALRWDEGRLAELPDPSRGNAEIAPAALALITAARGDGDRAAELIRAELDRPEPVVWTSHGRWAMLAHAVADLG